MAKKWGPFHNPTEIRQTTQQVKMLSNPQARELVNRVLGYEKAWLTIFYSLALHCEYLLELVEKEAEGYHHSKQFNRRWTPEDDELVLACPNGREHLDALADQLDRSPGSIRNRRSELRRQAWTEPSAA